MSAKRFIVRGRVQGVMFRVSAAAEAERLGVSGRIWNRDDGAVEAEASGGAEQLAAFERWLHHGPSHGRVGSVDAEDLPSEPRYRGFAAD